MYSENIHINSEGVSFTDKHGNKLSFIQALNKALERILNWWTDLKLFILHLVTLHVPLWTIRLLVLRLAGVKVGKGSVIHVGSKFFEPKNVQVGKDSKIGEGVFLDGRALLSIGNHVDIASDVLIYNSEHDLESPTFMANLAEVVIGDYVFVGPRAIILPGVTIGKGAVVGAGAVVTKSVEAFKIVGGVPAKIIGERVNKDLKYTLGRSRLFQ